MGSLSRALVALGGVCSVLVASGWVPAGVSGQAHAAPESTPLQVEPAADEAIVLAADMRDALGSDSDVAAQGPEAAAQDSAAQGSDVSAVVKRPSAGVSAPRGLADLPPLDPPRSPAARKSAAASKPKTLKRVYRVTAYCDQGTTASGTRSGVGQCAAPAHVPFGARVHIPQLRRTFVVTDRTHPRFRHNTVDIFIPTAWACKQFGRNYLECIVTLPDKAR